VVDAVHPGRLVRDGYGLRAVFADAAENLMTRVLDRIRLHDGTVMQGFARIGDRWVFSQVTQAGRAGRRHAWHEAHGNLTLTLVSAAGARLGHMYLRGFGHGISISAQPAETGFWVWAEALSRPSTNKAGNVAGSGTAIAQFRWNPGITLTASSPHVRIYRSAAWGTHVSPCLDNAHNVMTVRYTDSSGVIWVTRYALDAFLQRDYTSPLSQTSEPPSSHWSQGWAVNGDSIMHYVGEPYSVTNPKPGDAQVITYGTDGGLVGVREISYDLWLTHREPEGITPTGCVGLASGKRARRRASVYC